MPQPLELPGWIEFNTARTGLTPRVLEAGSEGASARITAYVDARGRMQLPRNNPYLPVSIAIQETVPSRWTTEWHRLADTLIGQMRRLPPGNQLYLSPEVDDVRPWTWADFIVGVRYTYLIDFPHDPGSISRNLRRDAEKAQKAGFSARHVDDVQLVLATMADTEARQQFSHHLTDTDLRLALRLLGPEALRLYVTMTPDGRPASSAIALHQPGERAVLWTSATINEALAAGASPLTWRFLLEDLAANGATGIDLCGANMASVAAYKSRWGARLAPNFSVRRYSLRAGARFLAEWRASRRSPRE